MPHRTLLCALFLLASSALAGGCSVADNANSGASSNANTAANANSTNTNAANSNSATTGATTGATSGATSGTTSGTTSAGSTANANSAAGVSNSRPTVTSTNRNSPGGIYDRPASEPYLQQPPSYQGYPATAASSPPGDIAAAPPAMSAPTGTPIPPDGGAETPTPTPAPGGDSVDAYLSSLPRGEVAFNTPEKMRLGQSVNVEVKLGKANLAGQLEKLIKEEGQVESHPIKVGNVMEAQLAGAGFEIIPITPAEQPLSDSTPTEWEWQVKAKQEGTQRLHLTLTVVVFVEGKERRRKIDTFKKDILVEVTSGSRIAGFVYDNVGWIVTGLLFPLFGGLGWRMRQLLRRRRGDGQPPAAPPAT